MKILIKTVYRILWIPLLLAATHLEAASVIQFAATTYNVIEGTSQVGISVQRTDDLGTVVSVGLTTTTSGTATAGADYIAVSTNLTFLANDTNNVVAVPILNDGLVEGLETFQVTLSNPTGGAELGVRTTATVRITDNDTGLAFEFANYWVRENEGSVLFGVVRGDDGDFPVTVNVSTADGSAQAGLDYAGVTNTIAFAAGEKVKLFAVPILNDGLKEASKTFRLVLSNPGGGAVVGSPSSATVTIIDNDPGVQFTENQVWVQEQKGSVLLTVARGNDQLLDAFTVDYATIDGTAIAGSDYTQTKGTLAFAKGEMNRSFSVPILDDGVAKKDRQFKVMLGNPTGGMALGAVTNATATVTICDVREMLPHRFDAVDVSPSGTVSLTLGGGFTPGLGLSNRFQPYFDVYPVEVSTNLVDWMPLTWLVRTNALTNAIAFIDPEAAAHSRRFYRTPAASFVAPQRVPSGPYPVGVTYRSINDGSRRNRYRVSTNGWFPITIWYPAQRVAGRWPAAFEMEAIAREARAGSDWLGWIDRVPHFCSYSVADAPFAAGLAKLPVVFWSHGYPDYRNDAQELAEHLASHGYVVVAVDHSSSSFVEYPDGTYIYTDWHDQVGRELSTRLLQDNVRDFVVVLDEMTHWNEQDDLFVGRLNTENTAAMGWSYGGGVSAEFCRVDPRAKAAIVLEGYFQNADTVLASGITRPVLSIYSSGGGDSDLFNKLTHDAAWFQIRNTQHESFGTGYWCDYWVTSKSITLEHGREVARTIADYSLWFLNKYLKGITDPMPAPTNYPQIFNFKQK